MAPCTFLEPAYSPRSSCSTLRPRLASVRAAALPAIPAPTAMASNLSSIMVLSLARYSIARVRRQALAKGFGQRRQQSNRIGDDADMGEVEDGGILVGIDSDDEIGALRPDPMLYRPRNPRSDIELWPYRFSGLADLAIGFDPAFLNERARAAILRAEHGSQLTYQLKVFRGAQ